MTLTETKKLAKHICRLLKVPEITMPIGRTAKGNLGLVFGVNNDEYAIMLDSVPLSTINPLQDENNIELKRMLEKYLFTPENTIAFPSGGTFIPSNAPTMSIEVSPAKEMKKPAKNGNAKAKKSS